jgi:hypothetical protein
MTMQETVYNDRNGERQRMVEMFNLPDDPGARESVMRRRYEAAIRKVFGEGGDIVSIKQRKIGRNDSCPCGSGRKFKRCCEGKLNVAIATGD